MRKFAMGLVMLTSLGAVACGDPAIGSWSSSYDSDGTEIDASLTLDKDGTGTMKITAEESGIMIDAKFDVDWEKTSKGEYELTMTCTDISMDPEVPGFELTCDDFEDDDDKSTCKLNDAKDELECDSDDGEDPVVLKAD